MASVSPSRHTVLRDKNQRVERIKTPRHWWFRLRPFEEYAKAIPPLALNILRFMAWVREGNCWIPDKHKSGKMSPMVFNRGQLMILDAMLEQAFAGKPVRLIIPKSRRQGVSTLVTLLFRFLCHHLSDRNAKLVAHSDSSAKEIFDIVRRCHARVLWQTKKKNVSYSDINAKGIKFDDTDSEFVCMTAQGRHTGSGTKTDYLEVSELAKLDKTSNQDTKALDSLLPTVTDGDPNTIIVIESTGQGSAGEFYRRTMAALGREGEEDETKSPYKVVFLSWLIDPMCEAKSGFPATFDGFRKKLSGYELLLKNEHGATPAQIQWRREKLRERGISDYAVNPVGLALEFPLVCDDCFRTQAGRVYSQMNPEYPQMQDIPMSKFSNYAIHARAMDWGSSAESPFVCIWMVVDPEKPAGLVVSPNCAGMWEEFANYLFDPLNGEPVKQFDHSLDALRYYIMTMRPRGLVYVRKELFVRENLSPQDLARRVHQESGYVHPSGNPDDPDVSKYVRGPGAFTYQCAVADRARNDLIGMWNDVFKIEMVGYKPLHPKDSGKGIVMDSIALVQALTAGNIIFEPEVVDPSIELARAAARKLRSQREWPTDEEFAAYERLRDEQLGELSAVNAKRLTSTGWREICG